MANEFRWIKAHLIPNVLYCQAVVRQPFHRKLQFPRLLYYSWNVIIISNGYCSIRFKLIKFVILNYSKTSVRTWGPFLESPFRAHFGWHNSLFIFKTKASRSSQLLLCSYFNFYSLYKLWTDQGPLGPWSFGSCPDQLFNVDVTEIINLPINFNFKKRVCYLSGNGISTFENGKVKKIMFLNGWYYINVITVNI